MRRRKSINSNPKSLKYRFLYSAALLLTICGVWLICYESYHYSRSIYAFHGYSEVQPVQAGNDMNSLDRILPVQKPTFHSTSFKQALQKEEAQLLYFKRPKRGEQIGVLSFPKLNLTLPIIEGTGADELDLGVGHYVGSVLPGEKDNCVLSGHRNTVFQELGKVGVGDSLQITTEAGSFQYIVDKVRIVDKEDRTVIVPKPRATLTVSTCYPFVYTGAAPKRYILVAHLAVE